MSLAKRLVNRLIYSFAPANGAPPQTLWQFARWSLRGGEKAIGLTMIITFVAGLTELVAANFTRWIIDSAVETGPGPFWGQFWPIILFGLAFFLILRPAVSAVDAWSSSMLLGPNLYALVLSRVNRHVLGHSMQFFDNDFAGRITQKALQTSNAITDVVVEFTDVVIYSMAIFLGALILMGGIDLRLLAVFVLWGALYFAALRHFIPQVQTRAAARAGARSQVTGQIVDTLSNIATVKLFAHSTAEDRAAQNALSEFRDRALDYGEVSTTFRVVLMTLGGLLPMCSILGALYLWTIGAATPGDIALTAIIAGRLGQLTNRLGRVATSIYTNIGEIEDGIATLAKSHAITDRHDAQDAVTANGAIRFDDVCFAYGGDVAALTNLSLDIQPGEKVALVGASGAGKSTFVSLLLRLYDAESGRITLDGIDINALTQEALRRQIAVVRQETAMFNRSAMENIRYGQANATDEQVIAAARRAAAHDFILALQDSAGRRGYDARLGERGVKLSGGQRQRIALARAILKDAPILVLDEATSALDSQVEAQIQAALSDVMQGKTVIAIAHRLSTIAQMDRIVVLQDGQIAEIGTHADLLAMDGLYSLYWNRQSGGFIRSDLTE